MICRLAAVEHRVPNLTHKKIDIECAMENLEAWFVRMQPVMTVPCMKYGDDVIGDSKDIMYYLSKQHPEVGLYPADHRTTIDAFLDLFYSKFGTIARFTFGHFLRRSEETKNFIARGKTEKSIEKLKQLIEEAPDLRKIAEAKLASKTKFDFVKFMLSADLQQMDAGMQEVLDTMEECLAKDTYMCGDSYTLADITATAFLARVHIVKQESMFGPNTVRYWNQTVKTRPSFVEAYICSNWNDTLMSKQIEAFAGGLDPETVVWTGPPGAGF
jgi:glutathione S-transferase